MAAEVEGALRELRELRNNGKGPKSFGELAPAAQEVMRRMLQTGMPEHEWELLKPLVALCLEAKLDEFRAAHPDTDPKPPEAGGDGKDGERLFQEHKGRLLTAIDLFEGSPFTLQRLCELIMEPETNYKSVNKLLFGLEKLLSVSSVLEVERLPTAAQAALAPGQEAGSAASGAKSGTVAAQESTAEEADEAMGDGDGDGDGDAGGQASDDGKTDKPMSDTDMKPIAESADASEQPGKAAEMDTSS